MANRWSRGARKASTAWPLSNCMHLSSWLGQPVTLPIDEDLFYEKLSEKIAVPKSKPVKASISIPKELIKRSAPVPAVFQRQAWGLLQYGSGSLPACQERISNMFTNIELSGFSDEISPDFDQQLKVINQLGIKYIEIRGVDGKNISELTPQEVEQVKAKLDAAGVQVSSIGSPIGKISITDDFAPHLENFRQLLATAKVLQTRYIRMFSFYIPEGEDPARYRNEVIARLKVLIAEAEKADVVLLHENEKEIYGDTDCAVWT